MCSRIFFGRAHGSRMAHLGIIHPLTCIGLGPRPSGRVDRVRIVKTLRMPYLDKIPRLSCTVPEGFRTGGAELAPLHSYALFRVVSHSAITETTGDETPVEFGPLPSR
jgi:hypothetical protein